MWFMCIVCMFVVVCVYAYTCIHVICMHMEARDRCWVSSCLYLLCFETRCLTEPGAHLSICLCLPSDRTEDACCYVLLFGGSWDLNLCSHGNHFSNWASLLLFYWYMNVVFPKPYSPFLWYFGKEYDCFTLVLRT